MDNISVWKQSFLQKSMVVDPDNFPFMVVGNKSDLDGSNRVVNFEQAQQVVKELGEDIDIIETSAKDNSNVNSAFMMLARKALKR